jgi:hypothetical protein
MRHGLYFFASNSEDGENSYEYKYESSDLIHPEREVVVEYIFSITRKELEKKYKSTKQSEPERSYVPIRKVSVFCHFRKGEKYPPTEYHIDDREGKEGTSGSDDTIFVVVYERHWRVPCYPVDLSSEKSREVPEKSAPKKCMSNNIEVCRAVFFILAREYHKYQTKTKYRSEERKVIVLRDKKQS